MLGRRDLPGIWGTGQGSGQEASDETLSRPTVPHNLLRFSLHVLAQDNALQVNAPVAHRTMQAPDPNASAADLEAQGYELRAEKGYLDAMDFYHAAMKKASTSTAKAQIWNKIGITELQTGHFREAKKGFERAIKADATLPEPHNNLGVVYYEVKKYDKAIKNYEKAIALKEPSASFHSNLDSAYFAKKQFDLATQEYGRALQLDPTIFQRKSQIGIAARCLHPKTVRITRMCWQECMRRQACSTRRSFICGTRWKMGIRTLTMSIRTMNSQG